MKSFLLVLAAAVVFAQDLGDEKALSPRYNCPLYDIGGRSPRVFCDEFVTKFVTKFGDKFSESPNFVINFWTKLVTNVVMNCIL